jgi:hypothetical protein
MDITPFAESLRSDLARAAEVGGPDVRAAAERLSASLEAAVRLAFMEALSQAAAEISAELASAAVEVRLNGREPVFVVSEHPGPSPQTPAQADEGPEDEFGEGENLARITLRIPEPLKVRAEALAARRGQSLNTWLVGAARAATAGDPAHSGRGGAGRHRLPKRLQGWAR